MSWSTTKSFDALEDFAGPGGWDEGAKLLGLSTSRSGTRSRHCWPRTSSPQRPGVL